MFQSPLNTQKYNVSAKIIQLDQKPIDVVLVAHRWLCIRSLHFNDLKEKNCVHKFKLILDFL